jgi:hypothetical protein
MLARRIQIASAGRLVASQTQRQATAI